MKQDEIIEMARQAGMAYQDDTDRYIANIDDLQDFAKLVALRYEKKISDLENIICQRHWDVLQEREACAELRKTLSAIPNRHVPQLQLAVESALDFYAERIRARGEA